MRGSPGEADPEVHIGPEQSKLGRAGTAGLRSDQPAGSLSSDPSTLPGTLPGDLLLLSVPILGAAGISQA